MHTDTATRSAAALVLRAGDVLDVAGLDADAIAAGLDAADATDTRDTYGANYHAAVRAAARAITRTADRLSGTTVRNVDRRTTVVRVTVGGGTDVTRALYRLADDLTLAILGR